MSYYLASNLKSAREQAEGYSRFKRRESYHIVKTRRKYFNMAGINYLVIGNSESIIPDAPNWRGRIFETYSTGLKIVARATLTRTNPIH